MSQWKQLRHHTLHVQPDLSVLQNFVLIECYFFTEEDTRARGKQDKQHNSRQLFNLYPALNRINNNTNANISIYKSELSRHQEPKQLPK